MIVLSDAAAGAVLGSWVMYTRVESWLGDQLLADDVPVVSGAEEVDRSLRVPERLTLSVPRVDRAFDWSPDAVDHPLAPFGQRLRVSIGVGLAGGAVEWVTRGWYLIHDVSTDSDTVSVTAVGLLQLVDEARFVSPFQPSGTLAAAVRVLVEPALTVSIDASLTNRAVPAGIAWDEDRLGGLLELLDAWPADARVTEDGYLSVVPATDPATSVLALTDGSGGTVVGWAGSATRDGAATVVVARGSAADGGVVQGTAYDTAASSATRYGGPFSPLPVPLFFTSPLLTTGAQCSAAARTILARRQRTSARGLAFEAVPHPGLQVGDRVDATTGAGTVAAVVESLRMPVTPDAGAMSGTLRVIS